VFASRLREAQCLSIKIKNTEQKGKKKVPQTYLHNSKKTQYRREKAWKDLASKGFLDIASFMALNSQWVESQANNRNTDLELKHQGSMCTELSWLGAQAA